LFGYHLVVGHPAWPLGAGPPRPDVPRLPRPSSARQQPFAVGAVPGAADDAAAATAVGEHHHHAIVLRRRLGLWFISCEASTHARGVCRDREKVGRCTRAKRTGWGELTWEDIGFRPRRFAHTVLFVYFESVSSLTCSAASAPPLGPSLPPEADRAWVSPSFCNSCKRGSGHTPERGQNTPPRCK